VNVRDFSGESQIIESRHRRQNDRKNFIYYIIISKIIHIPILFADFNDMIALLENKNRKGIIESKEM